MSTAPGDRPGHADPAGRALAVGRPLAVVLGLLTVFGPISMDLYLPVLPALTRDLGSATSTAQLSITACLLGLAGGQVVAGPLSDRLGRRRPLLVGVALYILTSLLCAFSPNIGVLIAARFAQGLAGAVGIVIAQAAGRDVYSGRRLVRYYGQLTVLGGLAAIIGPVIGGQLATITDWRGVFVFLSAVGVVILIACLTVFAETLPDAQRHRGGLTRTGGDCRRLLGDSAFLGPVLVTGFLNAALFAYLAGATFVLQGIYNLSPQQYSLAFGLNSLGFVVVGLIAGRLGGRLTERQILAAGLLMCVIGAGGLLVTALLALPLVAVLTCLLIMVSGVAATSPAATALAMADYPDIAGTAASLLGLTRYAFGALAAPVVGLGGAGDAVPLGVVTVVCTLAALIAFTVLLRRPRPRKPATPGRGTRGQ